MIHKNTSLNFKYLALLFLVLISTVSFSQWQYITTKNSSLLMTSNGTGYYYENTLITPSSGYKYSISKTTNDWQTDFFVAQNVTGPSPSGVRLTEMEFINDTTGFCHIHGATDVIYGTTTSAVLWNNPYQMGGAIGNFSFLSKDLGYIIEFYSPYNLSKCIGNYSITSIPTNQNLNYNAKIYFNNDTTGYLYGQNSSTINVLVRTNNSGVSWTNQLSDTNNAFNKIYFPSDQIGYIAANNGKVFKTTNAGISWTKLSLATTNNLYSVSFINDTIGFVGGTNGSVYKTIDGGLSWQSENSTITHDIKKLYFFKSGFVYAVSNSGELIKRYLQVGLKDQQKIFQDLKVFPNPATDQLSIEVAQLLNESSFSLYNINGQEIINQNINELKTQIDISKLAKGVYYLKIKNVNGVQVKKIIKE
ncbi:MAG: T9SS type A sorting domain-containing protein [Bacteroidia bacterium]